MSEAPQRAAAPRKYESYNKREKTEQEKKDELITAMIGKMGEHEDDEGEKGAEEDTAGVDSDEWVCVYSTDCRSELHEHVLCAWSINTV